VRGLAGVGLVALDLGVGAVALGADEIALEHVVDGLDDLGEECESGEAELDLGGLGERGDAVLGLGRGEPHREGGWGGLVEGRDGLERGVRQREVADDGVGAGGAEGEHGEIAKLQRVKWSNCGDEGVRR
jgi:hypothetical protein